MTVVGGLLGGIALNFRAVFGKLLLIVTNDINLLRRKFVKELKKYLVFLILGSWQLAAYFFRYHYLYVG